MNINTDSSSLSANKNVPTVLILGAGVAGVRAALHLKELNEGGKVEIVVIDEKCYHLLIPNLHEAATSRISTKAVQVPLEQIFQDKNITFHRAKISKINLEKKVVLANGVEISYDFLIIALGGRANFYNIPGLMESAFPLRSLKDAETIRTHILEMFELAAGEQDPQKRKELLTFVVGGVGAAGTQLVTELADWIRELKERYDISQDTIQVIAVEALETMGIDQPLVRYAYEILRKKGIRLILGAAIQSVNNPIIRLRNGKRIRARTLIWTGGIKGNELIAQSGLQVNHQGRARVNKFLEAIGYASVYVIGDASIVTDLITGKDVFPSAQMAINEAAYVAEHVMARIHQLQIHEYRPQRRGVAISLGRTDGASLFGGIRLLGKIGKFFKTLTELRYLYLLGGLQQVVQVQRRRSQKVMLASY